jgi:hypothetical protein
MGSTARSPRVRARVTPHRGQGESLVPLYTRESVSLLSAMGKMGFCSSREAGSRRFRSLEPARERRRARAPGYGVSIHAAHVVRRAAVEVGDELG